MKVSLILATVGRTTEIGRCLQSLVVQTDRNFEVLLVDQNQDDRLEPYVQEARSFGIALTHLRMDKASLSGARNLGIAQSSGDVIALTDDDCWYEPDAIGAIRSVLLTDPTLDGAIAQWVEQSNARQGGPMTGLLAQSAWRSFRGGDASSISLFLKKPLFTRLGGFDEHFGVGQWYGAAEETDFLLRALADSAKLLHCPIARVHHHFPTGALLATHIACLHARRRARGTGAIYAKHRLNLWVVMRGFIAPWLMPLRHGKLQHAKLGIFVTLGRIEGFMRWKLQDHT